MKSRWLTDNASARTTRATWVHETSPMTIRMLTRLGLSTATSAIASSNAGSVSMTSVNRINATSTAPRKNPAARPIATPIVIVTSIPATPTINDTRAP